jgi:DNA polymerase III subunit epsilon
MRPTLFAITDIETTGGSPAEGGITEIAIVIHDGSKIIDRFHSLINPGMPVPRFITALTGIDNTMLEDAPSFEDIAYELYKIFEDKTFVAHNVNFDHSFLHHRFKQLDLHFQPPKLCTVRYARKVLPGLSSYSLGNLCRNLGIPIQDRHRAAGDVEATSRLFEYMLQRDKDFKSLGQMLKGHNPESYLPMHLPAAMVEQLPYCPGIYYFKDQYGKVLYVGKAVNLKYRVKSHFTNNAAGKRRQEMLRRIYSIDYKTCPTELMATVLESLEIKRLWPPFNRSQKTYEATYGVYQVTDRADRIKLIVCKKRKHLPALFTCAHPDEAIRLVGKLAADLQLPAAWVWGKYDQDADIAKTANEKTGLLIQKLEQFLPDFALIENGQDEAGNLCYVIYRMQKGAFTGMGISKNIPLQWEDMQEIVEPYHENAFIRGVLHSAWLQQKGTIIMPDNRPE